MQKNLAKISLSTVFHMPCMRRKDLRTFIEFYMETHAGAHPDGYQHGGRKPTEITVTEFC